MVWFATALTANAFLPVNHDDVIKWKHFPRYWPFVRGIHRSPVNSTHKGQCRGALMFSLICVWINDWVNNREAGDLRRYHAHYDVIVMISHDGWTVTWLLTGLALTHGNQPEQNGCHWHTMFPNTHFWMKISVLFYPNVTRIGYRLLMIYPTYHWANSPNGQQCKNGKILSLLTPLGQGNIALRFRYIIFSILCCFKNTFVNNTKNWVDLLLLHLLHSAIFDSTSVVL